MFKRTRDPSYSRPPMETHASSSSSTPNVPKRKRTTPRNKTTKHVPDPQFVGGEPSAPTQKEWEIMTPYHSFVVPDNDGNEHRFPILTYALVLPEGADPRSPPRLRDYWVGKIKEIRARSGDPSDVWASIQWLMSIHDINAYKRVNPAQFGKMERILSNHFDFVHTSCFADLARVVPYLESDAEPAAINDETFYYRYTFDIFSYELKPIPSATCFCGEAYNPNESPVMHFCPRKGCCKAFHADCLRITNYIETPRKDLRSLRFWRGLQFEGAIYDSSEEEEQEDVQPPVPTASGSKKLASSSAGKHNRKRIRSQSPTAALPVDVDRHKDLPSSLVTLARSPMIKGLGTDLPYEWSCVVGNIAVISRARKLVHEVVHDGKRLPRKWRSLLEIPGEEDGKEGGEEMRDVDEEVVKWAAKDEELFLCPICKSAI